MKQLAAVTFACMLAVAAQADQNQAFQDAKTFAGSKNQGTFSGISSGAVSDKIPGYGTNPTETQFFQGGQGALSGPGVTKMQNCASYVPGQNKIANQECEAVNFLARNPDVRPQFNIGTNDPMILGAKNARDNAATVFQSLGINGGTSGAQCTTNPVTTPAHYSTETCTSIRAFEGQACTIGRVINIDADSNFQCDKTLTAFTSATRQPTVSTSACAYGRQVNIDGDSNFQCDKTLTAFTSATRQPEVSASSCTYGRQVDIDEDSQFKCDQTVNAYETLKCKRSSSVTCTGGGDGCDAGGLVPGSVMSIMPYTISMSTSGDLELKMLLTNDAYNRWWAGGGRWWDRELTFDISNLSLISKFEIREIGFNDWLNIRLNGHLIFNGPYGGNMLECYDPISLPTPQGYVCQGGVRYDSGPLGNWNGRADMATNWVFRPDGTVPNDGHWTQVISPIVDIRPYLVNGRNTISVRLIAGDWASYNINVFFRQVCPANCSITQHNQCATLEVRSQ